MKKPVVHVLGLGGTIAMAPQGRGVHPTLDADALIRSVPGLEALAELRVQAVSSVASANMGFEDMQVLADRIVDLPEDSAGTVILQGTDTMEETVFALDLMFTDEEIDTLPPVAVTGAMRHPGLASSDGPGNLMDAVRLITSGLTRGMGPLLVMNGQAHAARYVRKTHTSDVGAFRSPGTGPVARLTERQVRLLNYPLAPQRIGRAGITSFSRVGLYWAVMGDNGKTLDAFADMDGLVIAALGAGHLPEAMAERAKALAKDMPVVLASRTGGGEVFRETYGYAGGEMDLIEGGLIPAGAYDPLKARVILTLALSAGLKRARLADILAS